MKKNLKRTVSILMALMMLTSVLTFSASARASKWLSSYGVALNANGNSTMTIAYSVSGTSTMTTIGAQTLTVEKKVGGEWQYVTTYSHMTYSNFQSKNTSTHIGEHTFAGTSGVQYRVTLTAHAADSTGGDTGQVTSSPVTCS